MIFKVPPAAAHGAYATQVRQKLADSSDADLLTAAGRHLVINADNAKVDFDHVALGKSYLQRAVTMAPGEGANQATRMLTMLTVREEHQHRWAVLREKELERIGGPIAQKARAGQRLTSDEELQLRGLEYQIVSELPVEERSSALLELASERYMTAEGIDALSKDPERVRNSWSPSKKYATDLLALAPQFKNDPRYGDALYEGNVVLATHALREGDVNTAVALMNAALDAPRLSDTREFEGSADSRLVNYLLKVGERESVASFLERSAAINAPRKDQRLKDAAAIRAGRMPMSYQYMVTAR